MISDEWIYRKHQRLIRPSIDAIVFDPRIETVALVSAARVLFRLENDHAWDDLPDSLNYDEALNALGTTVSRLVQGGKKVVLLVDNPSLPRPEDCISRTLDLPLAGTVSRTLRHDCVLKLDRFAMLGSPYRQLLQEVQVQHPDYVRILDTTDILCDRIINTCQHARNGRILYSYTDHISDYAAGLVGERLNALATSWTAQSGKGATPISDIRHRLDAVPPKRSRTDE